MNRPLRPAFPRPCFPQNLPGMLFFLAYLLVALGPVPKVVLCIGDGGHLALEADPAADCSCPPGTSVLMSDCSECVDIPLLLGAKDVSIPPISRAGGPISFPPDAHPETLCGARDAAGEDLAAERIASPGFILPSDRSAVLLI